MSDWLDMTEERWYGHVCFRPARKPPRPCALGLLADGLDSADYKSLGDLVGGEGLCRGGNNPD